MSAFATLRAYSACVRACAPAASERQAVVKRHKTTTEVKLYASPLVPTENRRHRPGLGETKSIDVTSLAREGRALKKPAGRKRIDTARATGKKRASRPNMPRRAGWRGRTRRQKARLPMGDGRKTGCRLGEGVGLCDPAP